MINIYRKDRQMDFYDVTGKRELMIDDNLIANKRNLSFKQHEPIELPCSSDKPIGHFNSVVKNPDGTFFYYFRGDKIAFTPQWKGKNFSGLPAGKFRLRIKMCECDLFSISFK